MSVYLPPHLHCEAEQRDGGCPEGVVAVRILAHSADLRGNEGGIEHYA